MASRKPLICPGWWMMIVNESDDVTRIQKMNEYSQVFLQPGKVIAGIKCVRDLNRSSHFSRTLIEVNTRSDVGRRTVRFAAVKRNERNEK
jgi:hypothetical protein